MKYYKIIILATALSLFPIWSHAQQYTGMSGLIHVPSAEMNHEGDARIGAHFLNKNMVPDTGFIDIHGVKYNTYDYYLSLTPFNWLEISYTCTERKNEAEGPFVRKDRYASIKIRPMQEGKYHPAVALGFNDVGTTAFKASRPDVQLYFTNIYLAATKHLTFGGNELGMTLAYRKYFRGYNDKWSGLVGGLTFRPAFFPQARAIAEYTGNEFLLGVDALLWRHLLVQASVKDFKYINFGICFQMNLLGTRYKY